MQKDIFLFAQAKQVQLTEDQVNNIAPDPASIKAGNKVFTKTSWDIHKSDRAVWAPIKGSGSKPYLAQMDLTDLAFKCTCPSRKFPCKHGLAIGYFIAHHGLDKIPLAEKEPIWVEEWIDKRASKATKKAKPKKAPAPELVKKKNQDKWKKAEKGIESVWLWLMDVIKLGILEFPNKSMKYWEDLTKRMVDAKMPGINTYFKFLSEIDYQQENWKRLVLRTLGNLYLLTQAIQNHKNLDPAVKKELELLIGWNISKNDLINNTETEVVSDVWMIVKIEQTKNENLESRKVHLYGVQTNRHAYILEFAFGNTFFKDLYTEGRLMQAKLAFYPGIQKTRAFVKIKGNQTDIALQLEPIKNLAEANNHFKLAFQKFAWTFEVPQFIANVNVVVRDQLFFLIDEENNLLGGLQIDFTHYLKVLAQTQGHFFSAFVIQSVEGVRLLAIFTNEKITPL